MNRRTSVILMESIRNRGTTLFLKSALGCCIFLTGLLVSSVSAGTDAWDDDFPYAHLRQARISLIQGEVMFQRGDNEEWMYAALNVPLRPHDKIWVGEDSRCEIQMSGGSIVRLAENTNLDLLALDEDLVQVDLTYGVATLRSREGRRGGILEVATPGAAIEAGDAGFRVDVDLGGNVDVAVDRGHVDVESVAGPVRISEGQQVSVFAEDPPRFIVATALPDDEWDRWNQRRDRQLERPGSREFVETSDPWVADLDLYGSWTVAESYGRVWVPAVRAGWAPYRHGKWTWVEPWGWSWISYERWGWGPYHYGRWVHLGRRGWGWVPGRRLVWVPANARFIYGTSWVGWVPLGYGDRYDYRPRPRVGVAVGLSNYGIHGAVTLVSNVGFLSGDYDDHRVHLRRDPLRAGGRLTGYLPLKPVRQSLAPVSRRPVRRGNLPPPHIERGVVHLRDSAVRPTPFSRKHKARAHTATRIEKVPAQQKVQKPRQVRRSRTSEAEKHLRTTVVRKSVRQRDGNGRGDVRQERVQRSVSEGARVSQTRSGGRNLLKRGQPSGPRLRQREGKSPDTAPPTRSNVRREPVLRSIPGTPDRRRPSRQ